MKTKKFSDSYVKWLQPDGSLSYLCFDDLQFKVTAREVYLEAKRRGLDVSQVDDAFEGKIPYKGWRQVLYDQPWFLQLKASMLGVDHLPLPRPVLIIVETTTEHRDTPARRIAFGRWWYTMPNVKADQFPVEWSIRVPYTGETMAFRATIHYENV